MEVKYFQKLKCDNWKNLFNDKSLQEQEKCSRFCSLCEGSNIVKGVDITETIKLILEDIDNADDLHFRSKNIFKRIIEENIIKVEE